MEKELNIKLEEYSHTCFDGCCHDYGVRVYVNDIQLEHQQDDIVLILEDILTHLGYKINIQRTFEND